MFRWIRKYFIPHPENEHQPHLLRAEIATFLLALIVGIELIFLGIIFYAGPFYPYLSSILPNVLIGYANADRQTLGENELTPNALLQKAAQAKANDMAQKGYFSH